jgi:hypothetical protein
MVVPVLSTQLLRVAARTSAEAHTVKLRRAAGWVYALAGALLL